MGVPNRPLLLSGVLGGVFILSCLAMLVLRGLKVLLLRGGLLRGGLLRGGLLRGLGVL